MANSFYGNWIENNLTAIGSYTAANLGAYFYSTLNALPVWTPVIVTSLTSVFSLVALWKNIQHKTAQIENQREDSALKRAQTRQIDEEVDRQVEQATAMYCKADKCMYRTFFEKWNPESPEAVSQ